MANSQDQTVPKKHSEVKISTFIYSLIIVAVVGFIVGTRSQEVLGVLKPLVGIKSDNSKVSFDVASEVFDLIKDNYDGKVDVAAAEDGAAKGLTTSVGDPYTVFLSKKDATAFEDSLNGRVSGIGAEIGVRNNQPTILRLIDNSPAKSSGLTVGDQIVKVNDTSTVDATADKAASLIRGDIGTTVKITITRDDGEHDYTITRAQVTDPSVASSINGTTGVITIRRFDGDTGDLAKRSATKLISDGVKSIVLDLRDDGGGELEQTGLVAGLWLDSGQTVVTVRKGDKVQQTVKASGEPILKGVPTAILTNGGTASASEIVAGALKDHKVASIIGEKTFGKGSVQQVFQLSDGRELKVTIARWFTPNGNSIDKKGISPDSEVKMTTDDLNANKDPQLDAALTKLR